MESRNKEIIQNLYATVFNNKEFDKLSEFISAEYSNTLNKRGVRGFQELIFELLKAFPNARWEIIDMIAENNKVIVKHKFSGTQRNVFQNILPTNKTVSVDGITTYELYNSKIINSGVQTDRLSFLQQLGVLPPVIPDTNRVSKTKDAISLIDKFTIPKDSIEEFLKQMEYNKNIIKLLSGYIGGQLFKKYDNEGGLTIITVAFWENKDKLDEAKTFMQNEFKKIRFNPIEFYERLNIKMERGQYQFIGE